MSTLVRFRLRQSDGPFFILEGMSGVLRPSIPKQG